LLSTAIGSGSSTNTGWTIGSTTIGWMIGWNVSFFLRKKYIPTTTKKINRINKDD
jgi:hypothetical protein